MAIEQLKVQKQPVTGRNIGAIVSIPVKHLKHHPHLEKLINRWRNERAEQRALMNPQREEEVLQHVEQAIAHLKTEGRRVTQRQICEVVGMSHRALTIYPRVKAKLRQVTESRGYGRRDEESVLKEVQQALLQLESEGKPLTRQNICAQLRISTWYLYHHPRLKALLPQQKVRHVKMRPLRDLLGLVEEAIEQAQTLVVNKVTGEQVLRQRVSTRREE